MYRIFGGAILMAAMTLATPIPAADRSAKAGKDVTDGQSGESLTAALWLQVERLRREVHGRRMERAVTLLEQKKRWAGTAGLDGLRDGLGEN